MAASARFSLRRARDLRAGDTPRRIASMAEGLAILRQLRIERGRARQLVHAAGTRVHAQDDVLRALATLLWRGAYVVCEEQRAYSVPPTESSAVEETENEVEAPTPGPTEEGHPPAIVPYAYPQVATYITSGVWAAEREAESELEAQLYTGLAPLPDDVVPTAYRDMASTKEQEIVAATHHASTAIERLLHNNNGLTEPIDRVPDTYREIADGKRAQVTTVVGSIADRLGSLFYQGDTDLALAEGDLFNDQVGQEGA